MGSDHQNYLRRLSQQRRLIDGDRLKKQQHVQFFADNSSDTYLSTGGVEIGGRVQRQENSGIRQVRSFHRTESGEKEQIFSTRSKSIFLRFVFKLNASGIGADIEFLELFNKSRGFLSIPKQDFPFVNDGTNFIWGWVLDQKNVTTWEQTPIYLSCQKFFRSLATPRTEFSIYRKLGTDFELVSTVIFHLPGNPSSGFFFDTPVYFINQNGYFVSKSDIQNQFAVLKSIFAINKNILAIGQSFGPSTRTEINVQLNGDFTLIDNGDPTNALLSPSSIIKTDQSSFNTPIAVGVNRVAFVKSNFYNFAVYVNIFQLNNTSNAQIKIDFNDGGQIYTLAQDFIDVTPGTFLYECFGQFIFDDSGDLILTAFQIVPNDIPGQHQIFLYRVVLVDGKLATQYQKKIKGPKEFFSYGPVDGQYFTNYFPQITGSDCLNEGKKLAP